MVTPEIQALLEERQGIRLDIACGEQKQPGFVGMDIQALPGVEIVHDALMFPWPLPDECVLVGVCSHFVEHIPPVMLTEAGTRFPFLEFMNEWWRVMKPDGEIVISAPHGSSQGFLQDPTHCNGLNETTWVYFDPTHPAGFWAFYRPKPWKVKHLSWSPVGNIEVVMQKLADEREGNDGQEV